MEFLWQLATYVLKPYLIVIAIILIIIGLIVLFNVI